MSEPILKGNERFGPAPGPGTCANCARPIYTGDPIVMKAHVSLIKGPVLIAKHEQCYLREAPKVTKGIPKDNE